ncbi:MAG: hypothetical protein ABIT38_16725, partial [Gemmatimonadaceae bacterium]
AGAQVGHTPRTSPFRDLEQRQEVTWFGGVYQTSSDPANVGPKSGVTAGMHYEFRMTGPAYFTATIAGVKTERRVIDPAQLIVNRFVGNQSMNLLAVDVGFALNLTGYKSWHGLVPTLGGGAGIGSAFDKADIGKYKYGFPFLLTARPGIKLAPHGRWQGRIDAANYFQRLRYPQTYFTKTTADPTVLAVGTGQNVWKRNLALTAGLTYAFGR